MLTLQFVPYGDLEGLEPDKRINKLLGLVKEEKIVLMQGRLKPDEEAKLIQRTMELINKTFKGVEVCTIYPEAKDKQLFGMMKKEMVKLLLGHRDGLTIIGPSSIVKEIKRDPNKIQLFTNVPKDSKNKRGKK